MNMILIFVILAILLITQQHSLESRHANLHHKYIGAMIDPKIPGINLNKKI